MVGVLHCPLLSSLTTGAVQDVREERRVAEGAMRDTGGGEAEDLITHQAERPAPVRVEDMPAYGEGGEDGPNEEVISQPESSSSSSSLLLSSLELSGTTIYEP